MLETIKIIARINKADFMTRSLVFVIFLMGFSACEKDELPVEPATLQGQTAELGEYYENMAYFDIEKNTFVKTLEHFGYDLSLAASSNGKAIFLNSSNIMYVKNYGVVPFSSITDTSGGSEWKYDFPTGNESRTAFGEWYDQNGDSKLEVYILDRGYDAVGVSFGFLKLQIISVSETRYKLKVAELDGNNERTVSIQKNPDKAKIQFSFNDDKVKDVEPNKNDWHLLFTQYTDYDITDSGDTIPYSVRGVLLNVFNTQAVKLENTSFDDITLSTVAQLEFSSEVNVIGYNWKVFSISSGYYTVLPDITFVVKNKWGSYYKLRFLDFYNDSGIKGYPKFELIGL